MYTVDYFIKKFEAIPEDKWQTHSYSNGAGKYCAFGFCGMTDKTKFNEAPEADALEKVMFDPARINDGLDHRYKQPTPKQRILAALYDIKKAQEGKTDDKILGVKPIEIKSEFIPVTFKEIKIPEHSIN